MSEKIWGVRNHIRGSWCCLEYGLETSDDPWRSTRKRADEVYNYLSSRFPHIQYEVKLYSRTEAPADPNSPFKVFPDVPV